MSTPRTDTEIVECTKEHPWDGKVRSGVRVRHSEVREVGEQQDGYPGGDIVTYECRNCGHRWTAELPQ